MLCNFVAWKILSWTGSFAQGVVICRATECSLHISSCMIFVCLPVLPSFLTGVIVTVNFFLHQI